MASLSIRLDELQTSGGAFHHYFDSRAALLHALIERIRGESVEPLQPIVLDPKLTAIQKLQRFVAVLDRPRIARRQDIVAIMRMWYSDSNAIVRQRVSDAILAQRAAWLTEIVLPGVEAIERVVGAPPSSLHRADAEAVMKWVRALSQRRTR